MSAVTWIFAIIGGLILVLLLTPIRMRIGAMIDDRQGFEYALNVDWALGVAALAKTAGRPWQLSIIGLKVMRFSGSQKAKKAKVKRTKEKKSRPWSFAGVVKDHFQTMTGIFDRMIRAAFLKGHLTGRIGLPDPADTATLGWLFRMANLPSRRFKLALACEYNEEIIQAEAAARATLIFGYLGLVAGMLLLRSQTRLMLHCLRQAR